MANPAYPSLPISQSSRRVMRDGRVEDLGSDGTVRVRKLHADKFDFEIVHPQLAASDVATLESFYASYSTASTIDFTWPEDGQVYVVRFGKGALAKRWISPTKREISVRLVGV